MKYKLTKKEAIEIELLISYYDSLAQDEEREKGDNPHAERDTLRGLTKLKALYDKLTKDKDVK